MASTNESRQNFVNGAYRIVFSDKKSSSKAQDLIGSPVFHNRTNIRDRSIDNIHGDAIPRNRSENAPPSRQSRQRIPSARANRRNNNPVGASGQRGQNNEPQTR